mgnify:CR=1 FL=1
MNKVYVNATSIKSVCGNTEETFEAIFHKRSGLAIFERIVPNKRICIGKIKNKTSFDALLYESVNEILVKSNLRDFSNTLLLVGSSVGGMASTEEALFKDVKYENIDIQKHPINAIASALNQKYNFFANRSFSTACTSSANALKVAKELIECGAYKNILVVGADEICATTIFGFNSLGILSDEICTPFKHERKGMNVAEGIGSLLLQNKRYPDSIEFTGAGTSSDAYHIANPDPNANGAISAITKALNDASVNARQVNYINAHGTGTQANDAAETIAIQSIFSNETFVSSSKPNIGHTLGAAGAIEAIICVEALKRQLLPPQINCERQDKTFNIVQDAASAKIEYALSNSFAFGGNNVSLVFGVCHEN